MKETDVTKPPALELRSVSYVAGGKTILTAVNWRVEEGQHWAILGPNGAGKTTLLKIACGYLWPNDGGSIYRRGKERVHLPSLRRSIGWVTSTLTAEIPPHEKVLRTVLSGKFAQIGYFEGAGGAATARDRADAEKYLAQLGCSDLRDREFGSLSQGEQQKILIARARMTEPYLIVLDEPCAGLDPAAREAFLASLANLAKQRRVPSLIYVTHHIEEILPVFGKTLVLKGGKIIVSGATSKIITPNLLTELYGVRLALIKRKGRFWPVVR